MQSSTRNIIIVAILLIFGGGLFYFGSQAPDQTPDELIHASLHDAEVAARAGSVGGVMDVVSDDFRSGTWNKARVRLLLSRTLEQARGQDYDVHVNAPIIKPSPVGHADERLVITRLAAFSPSTGEDYYKSNGAVTLIMRAETRRRWLIFREPYWRIVSMPDLGALPGSGDASNMGL